MRTATLTLLACTSAAHAAPTLGGPMSHLLVSVFQQQVYLSFESPHMSTVTMQGGDDFTGGASVLNGTGYNAQFGWLANGFVSIPPGSGVFVRELTGSPWLDVYSESGFEPILGTDGSDNLWQWDGTMTHNWYATEVQGTHRVEYEVFVGDALGNPLDGWVSGTIGLEFQYGRPIRTIGEAPGGSIAVTPSAGSLGVLGVGLLGTARRRR